MYGKSSQDFKKIVGKCTDTACGSLANNNRLYSTTDTPQAGVQRHHKGMRGAGVAPVGSRLPTARSSLQAAYSHTAPVVHLSQPKLVPTLLLGGQGYMCVNNLPKVVIRGTRSLTS